MANLWRNPWARIVGALVIGLLFGWVVSEISFAATAEKNQREPRQIELVIPAGTAAKIAAGQPAPDIPLELTFVEGDLLVVKNDDVVSHQLGPSWVPALSSSVLQVGSANMYSMQCSFTATKKFGLTVQPALTGWTRFQGLISVGLPTGVMLALYTLAVPVKKKEE